MRKLALLGFILFLANSAFANGGYQQTMDNYIVNLSLAPLVPRVGQETQMVFSFAKDEKLLAERLDVKILVEKESRQKIYEKSFVVESGAMDFSYVFAEAGRYHLRVEFLHKGKQIKTEFPLEAIAEETEKLPLAQLAVAFLAGALVWFVVLKLAKKV